MVQITSDVYEGQFRSLMNEIGERNYFSGEVQFDTEDYSHFLRCTLIVQRRYDTDGSGRPSEQVTDIMPVWWDESAALIEGEDTTDFRWSEFRKYFHF